MDDKVIAILREAELVYNQYRNEVALAQQRLDDRLYDLKARVQEEY